MKKIFTLIILSIFLFSCSEDDKQAALLGIWKYSGDDNELVLYIEFTKDHKYRACNRLPTTDCNYEADYSTNGNKIKIGDFVDSRYSIDDNHGNILIIWNFKDVESLSYAKFYRVIQ